MEDEAGPSASTSNEESTTTAQQSESNEPSDVPEVAVPDEILRNLGAQNVFRQILSDEQSKVPGMNIRHKLIEHGHR